MLRTLYFLSLLALVLLVHVDRADAVNIVRNSGFELDNIFCGSPMRQRDEFFQMFVKTNDKAVWTSLPVEGWWAEGADSIGISVAKEARSGERSLRLDAAAGPVSLISSLNRQIAPGPVSLSAWVRTQDCSGSIDLDFFPSWEQAQSASAVGRRSIDLPKDSDWKRIVLTGESPALLQALARIKISSGVVYIDDVQIEEGIAPTEYNLRPEEWIRLRFEDQNESKLAQWTASDNTLRRLLVSNDSGQALQGIIKVYLGPWNKPNSILLASLQADKITQNQPARVEFRTGKLAPDAYVITLFGFCKGKNSGQVQLSADKALATDQTIGGTVSNGMFLNRTAARFVVTSKTTPARIFGIGNSMLDTTGSWFSGCPLEGYAQARELGLTGVRTGSGEENIYLAAAAGVPIHVMGLRVDYGVPSGADFANPAEPSAIDFFNPPGHKFFVERAKSVGKEFGASPVIVSYQMSNESPYLNGGMLCPSVHADRDFRDWCSKRFAGNLGNLNMAWGTSLLSWNEIEQISSARFLEEERNKPRKQGASATDWLAKTGTFSAEVEQRMKDNPGWAMDWLRWRTETSLDMYDAFARQAKTYDKKTLYGTNLCWPAFWPQMFMPFSRQSDSVQLDIQYTSGFAKALGTCYEMMDSMEMAESVGSKPVWGIEVYVQPQFPAKFTAMQNWGLIAHGMTNNLVFAWKPYSDHGTVVGTKAWEKPEAHPMWLLIDNDNAKLPSYYSYTRSIAEVRKYHESFNGLSVKKLSTKVAFFVSADTAEYVILETGNKPWGSYWQRTRNNLIYLLRMNGISVDYVDDTTLPGKTGKYNCIVVPAACLLRQQSAAKLASFAKSGGTVVLCGVSGLLDPWAKPYSNIGGNAWQDLGWQSAGYKPDFSNVDFIGNIGVSSGNVSATEIPGSVGGAMDPGIDETKTFRGINFGIVRGASPILDKKNNTVGWSRPWGKGKLIVYGVFPDSYTADPHCSKNMTAWLQQMIKLAKIPVSGAYKPDNSDTIYGPVGTGSEVVEVVVRQKSPEEKFVFCMNQGGSGSGTISVSVGSGKWKAQDVITSSACSDVSISGGYWRMRVKLEPWDYRVIRLTKIK